MCEVEFWEVLDRMCKGFLNGAFSSPFVDCRIADLAIICERTTTGAARPMQSP